MPPTTADQPCPDEIETETDDCCLVQHHRNRRPHNAPGDAITDRQCPPRSTTPTSTTAISRSPRRRVGLDRCIGRENANDLSVPAASSQDFAARIGQAWRIGHRRGARLRPGTGPARAGGARANYWIQPAECPRFNAGNDAPRPPCCHPRGIPRHARSGPAAARDLMVAAAWVLLFVLITTFFPA